MQVAYDCRVRKSTRERERERESESESESERARARARARARKRKREIGYSQYIFLHTVYTTINPWFPSAVVFCLRCSRSSWQSCVLWPSYHHGDMSVTCSHGLLIGRWTYSRVLLSENLRRVKLSLHVIHCLHSFPAPLTLCFIRLLHLSRFSTYCVSLSLVPSASVTLSPPLLFVLHLL